MIFVSRRLRTHRVEDGSDHSAREVLLVVAAGCLVTILVCGLLILRPLTMERMRAEYDVRQYGVFGCGCDGHWGGFRPGDDSRCHSHDVRGASDVSCRARGVCLPNVGTGRHPDANGKLLPDRAAAESGVRRGRAQRGNRGPPLRFRYSVRTLPRSG